MLALGVVLLFLRVVLLRLVELICIFLQRLRLVLLHKGGLLSLSLFLVGCRLLRPKHISACDLGRW